MQLNNRADARHAVLSQSLLLNSLMVTTHKRSSTRTGSRSQCCFVKNGGAVLRLDPECFPFIRIHRGPSILVQPAVKHNRDAADLFRLRAGTNCHLFTHGAALSFNLSRVSGSSCEIYIFLSPQAVKQKMLSCLAVWLNSSIFASLLQTLHFTESQELGDSWAAHTMQTVIY